MVNNFNLYIDPLTGMNNLFNLLECDMKSTFGDKGTIIYIDIKDLMAVNNSYGRHIGDIYIKSLGDSINNVLSRYSTSTDIIKTYRVGGDEFLIYFASDNKYNLNDLILNIDSKLKQKMSQYNIDNIGIHAAIWSYSSKISSVSSLLKQCKISMNKSIMNEQVNTELPSWADEMIEWMFYRVKETLQLLQQSNSIALSDEISKLPNHRAANLYLNAILEQHRLFKKPFSVLFIDGDNLKNYNNLGYKYGNDMIRNLGSLISDSMRHNDKVFRWLSGDEFLVVLNETCKDDAYSIAERIRKHVEVKTSDWEYPITISVGVANYPVDGDDLDSVIAVSENANIQAKKSGKNCVL